MWTRPDGAVAILHARAEAREATPALGPVKTTVELPGELWRAAKIRAMDERVDLRTVFIRALEEYLGIGRGADHASRPRRTCRDRRRTRRHGARSSAAAAVSCATCSGSSPSSSSSTRWSARKGCSRCSRRAATSPPSSTRSSRPGRERPASRRGPSPARGSHRHRRDGPPRARLDQAGRKALHHQGSRAQTLNRRSRAMMLVCSSTLEAVNGGARCKCGMERFAEGRRRHDAHQERRVRRSLYVRVAVRDRPRHQP